MIKYTVFMPTHKKQPYLEIAIQSVLIAAGDRAFEFIILDDSLGEIKSNDIPPDPRIDHIQLPRRIDLVTKMRLGVNFARGKYFMPADHDDLSHPKRFEYADKLFAMGYDIVGAEQCVFYNAQNGKCYCLAKERLEQSITVGNTIYHRRFIQHSNSAIPIKWLKHNNYDGGRKFGITMPYNRPAIDTPLWIEAGIQQLKIGTFSMLDQEAWKQCFQIKTPESVNSYESVWDDLSYFVPISVELPPCLRK